MNIDHTEAIVELYLEQMSYWTNMTQSAHLKTLSLHSSSKSQKSSSFRDKILQNILIILLFYVLQAEESLIELRGFIICVISC